MPLWSTDVPGATDPSRTAGITHTSVCHVVIADADARALDDLSPPQLSSQTHDFLVSTSFDHLPVHFDSSGRDVHASWVTPSLRSPPESDIMEPLILPSAPAPPPPLHHSRTQPIPPPPPPPPQHPTSQPFTNLPDTSPDCIPVSSEFQWPLPNPQTPNTPSPPDLVAASPMSVSTPTVKPIIDTPFSTPLANSVSAPVHAPSTPLSPLFEQFANHDATVHPLPHDICNREYEAVIRCAHQVSNARKEQIRHNLKKQPNQRGTQQEISSRREAKVSRAKKEEYKNAIEEQLRISIGRNCILIAYLIRNGYIMRNASPKSSSNQKRPRRT